MKSPAMSCAVVMRNSPGLDSFEKQSATSNDAVLPLFDSKSVPKISILTFVNGSVTAHILSSMAFSHILMRSQVQIVHFLPRRMRLHS